MPIEIIRSPDQNFTEHVVTGTVSLDEMVEALENFYWQEPTQFVLWDMSKAESTHVTQDMLRSLVRRDVELGSRRRGGRTAICAPHDLQYALARMSEVFSEIEHAPFTFRVFRSRQDALMWLTSSGGEGDPVA